MDHLGGPPQPQMMTNAAQMQSNLAAMMWQMQMASPAQGQMMMPGMPPWPPAMPQASPMLHVRVEGLKFEYQLTEDDVRKVFARYGEVTHVNVDREGTQAQIAFEHPHQAVAAQHDLDRKQLAGMSGAYLRVEFPPAQYDANALAQMAAAASAAQHFAAAPQMGGMAGMPPGGGMGGYPPMMPPPMAGGSPMGGDGGRPRKYTCKLEVGIENEGEFRVGSRVIQVARQIWQDNKFQEHGGKTRLRGKGIGGPHEADEPLALCISCRDQAAFDRAVEYAEMQLQKVHNEYKAFCVQKGEAEPELHLKVSKKGSMFTDMHESNSNSLWNTTGSGEFAKGERPENAPTDEEIEKYIEKRNEARKAANFKEADNVRDFLKDHGVVLMDEKGAKGNFKGNEVTKWRFWRP